MPERSDRDDASAGERPDRSASGIRAFDAARAFDDHGSALLGFAVNALRDRPLAEDCVQETFLRAWRSRDRFDHDRASERTWLFAIARNVITDALRARSRLPRIGNDDELEGRSAPANDPLDRLQIVEGLARLSDPHREVILAVHVEGRTYQELSDATGVPVATWRTRAYHALRSMRRYLEGTEEPDVSTR
ncbi:sigma-70 family RNA polymerase sigma factor [Microbacterium sp. P04]|uniref:sigma-70 family RNA polymerase sigma factor n=1 Tax=Microbacterium sp. P04 TaxID=3366947 RepID=UPI00374780E1